MTKRVGLAASLVACAALASAASSTAEFRKLEYEVNRMKGGGGAAAAAGARRLADAASQIESLREQVARLDGRLEVDEHQAQRGAPRGEDRARSGGGDASRRSAHGGGGEGGSSSQGSPEEVQAYRDARAAWRGDDHGACIDRFREFLQTYPASDYADDAAYWMADCYFREGDFKAAVLRFDDVVQRYPAGDKAPDALYRQGEALLRLGPKYGSAADTAFERLINEYPDSPRVAEAKRQLELLGPAAAEGAEQRG